GFGLQQPLPQITIPLKPTDDGIAIDLQPIFEGVYDRGRYRSRIDYKKRHQPRYCPRRTAVADRVFAKG
ncbi:MAG: DUF4058 family protein, partial [Cyanobacteria bacterium P01_C01_bin.121]